ncbi:hypothetical protein ScalyP_jg341 [Parmales sp. scaly parma]|nr:hypothetical protein ScalyP_jg341 [Parmales sp. scaly parma]|tara:strand:- start:549 stop:947 length:399 start_codon:yes stop_codon:yes gene_type:complete
MEYSTFNTFLESTLKPALAAASLVVLQVQEDIDEYDSLRLALLQPLPSSTTCSLTPNLQCNAKLDNNNMVFIEVGLGFVAELSVPEALEFIEAKKLSLNVLKYYRESKVQQIKQHMEEVVLSLQLLQAATPN